MHDAGRQATSADCMLLQSAACKTNMVKLLLLPASTAPARSVQPPPHPIPAPTQPTPTANPTHIQYIGDLHRLQQLLARRRVVAAQVEEAGHDGGGHDRVGAPRGRGGEHVAADLARLAALVLGGEGVEGRGGVEGGRGVGCGRVADRWTCHTATVRRLQWPRSKSAAKATQPPGLLRSSAAALFTHVVIVPAYAAGLFPLPLALHLGCCVLLRRCEARSSCCTRRKRAPGLGTKVCALQLLSGASRAV